MRGKKAGRPRVFSQFLSVYTMIVIINYKQKYYELFIERIEFGEWASKKAIVISTWWFSRLGNLKWLAFGSVLICIP